MLRSSVKNVFHIFRIFIISFLVLIISSCTSVEVSQFKDEKPSFILEEYFNGNITAYGYFQKRSGLIVKRFKVDIKATWSNNVGILEEDFLYSDGTKSRRVWKIIKTESGRYIGTADDVIGEAKGEQAGNVLRWKYKLNLMVDNKNYEVNFDDWMYLMEDKILLNKSVMSKFGIDLGEVVLTFVKK